eukprot:gene22758-34857_t
MGCTQSSPAPAPAQKPQKQPAAYKPPEPLKPYRPLPKKQPPPLDVDLQPESPQPSPQNRSQRQQPQSPQPSLPSQGGSLQMKSKPLSKSGGASPQGPGPRGRKNGRRSSSSSFGSSVGPSGSPIGTPVHALYAVSLEESKRSGASPVGKLEATVTATPPEEDGGMTFCQMPSTMSEDVVQAASTKGRYEGRLALGPGGSMNVRPVLSAPNLNLSLGNTVQIPMLGNTSKDQHRARSKTMAQNLPRLSLPDTGSPVGDSRPVTNPFLNGAGSSTSAGSNYPGKPQAFFPHATYNTSTFASPLSQSTHAQSLQNRSPLNRSPMNRSPMSRSSGSKSTEAVSPLGDSMPFTPLMPGSMSILNSSTSSPPRGGVPGRIGTYHVRGFISKGSWAYVHEYVDVRSGKSFAIKSFNKASMSQDDLLYTARREVKLLRIAQQAGEIDQIVGMVESFSDKEWFHVVLQLADQGDLQRVIDAGGLPDEKKAGQVFTDLMKAIAHIHAGRYKEIVSGSYRASSLQRFSPELQNLIASLLELNPSLRPTAESVLQHAWLNDRKLEQSM